MKNTLKVFPNITAYRRRVNDGECGDDGIGEQRASPSSTRYEIYVHDVCIKMSLDGHFLESNNRMVK